uniref:ZP domain-containing protein n=1 Tax=Petromyzon marinus TaxID=7757 RepID=S4RE64_PETMA
LSVSCQFPTTDVVACFPNGTVAVAAPKGHTKPEVDLWRLALRERSCGPVYVNTTKAYFVFTVSSCGTSRTIEGAFLVYENEISLHIQWFALNVSKFCTVPLQRLKVICRYRINDTVVISSVVQARRGPTADEQLVPVPIVMKISRDADYTSYYLDEEYPVVSYLQEPLYFEVRLLGLEDQSIEMFLENCWATNLPTADSQPRWDIIVNRSTHGPATSCENANDNYLTVFHPVPHNSSVPFPQNVKRFEVKTFVFEMDIGNDFQGQLFFHCSVVVCDAVNFDDVCQMDCIPNRRRVGKSTLVLDLKRS